MARGRVPCWKADPPDTTTAAIAACFEPLADRLVKAGDEALYVSTNFSKKEADYEMLAKWKPLLAKLLSLDPRGAFFSQEDVHEALKICIAAKSLGLAIKVFAEKRGITEDEYMALLALKVRVMCGHERARQPRATQEPKKPRLHPFVAFRRTEEADEDDEDEEQSFLVTRMFDPSKR